MERSLRQCRDAAAERHDVALAQHPTREGDAFSREMQAVIDELVAVAKAADTPSADLVEVGKTYRWLGDAYFDLARGTEELSLIRAVQAYKRAEELFARSEAPVEKAKLDFNCGNALRGLSRGFDVALLEAAQTRYDCAKKTFEAVHLLDLVERVNVQLQILEPQMRLARKNAEIQRGYGRLGELEEQVEGASVTERDAMAQELENLNKALTRGDPSSMLAEAMDALRTQAEHHPKCVGNAHSQFDTLQEQVGKLKSLLQDATAEPEQKRSLSKTEELIIRALNPRLKSETESGRIAPGRAEHLNDLWSQFTAAMAEGGDDLESLSRRSEKMRDLLRRAMDFAMLPSWSSPDPVPGSRADYTKKILDPLRRYIAAENCQSMLPNEEASAGSDLLSRLMLLETNTREVGSDENRVEAMEGEVWRLALAIQEYARRYHLTVAQPDFAMRGVHADAKSLFLSGGEDLEIAAKELSTRSEITVFDRAGRGDYAQERWNQLCAASVAVFDVAVPERAEQAQVCYEVGLALALGKPAVVISRPRHILPFDINLVPVLFDDDADQNVDALDKGIQDALSSVVWGGAEAGLGIGPEGALTWLNNRFPDKLANGSLRIAVDLANRNRDDALAFRRSIEQLLGMLGADAPTCLLPAWPPTYPDPLEEPRCFHVMPFRPKWAEPTRDLAATRCRKHGWIYTRGDESDAQRIIRGIWREIGRASAVIIDITDHNPNVAVELGLVHGLGRPYRVIAQEDPAKHIFASLAKVQIHTYQPAPVFAGFDEIIDGFLESADP